MALQKTLTIFLTVHSGAQIARARMSIHMRCKQISMKTIREFSNTMADDCDYEAFSDQSQTT